MSGYYDINISNSAITTVPGASATIILFDSTADTGTGTTLARRRQWPTIKRAIVTILVDQNCTFFHDEITATSTSTWDTINGSGSGETITANTLFERDCRAIGDDFRLRVTTGTQPTVWRVSVRLTTDQALGQ